MKLRRGSRGKVPFLLNVSLGEGQWWALLPKKEPLYILIGYWVGPPSPLGVSEKRSSSHLCRISNNYFLVFQPLPKSWYRPRYTVWNSSTRTDVSYGSANIAYSKEGLYKVLIAIWKVLSHFHYYDCTCVRYASLRSHSFIQCSDICVRLKIVFF